MRIMFYNWYKEGIVYITLTPLLAEREITNVNYVILLLHLSIQRVFKTNDSVSQYYSLAYNTWIPSQFAHDTFNIIAIYSIHKSK